MTAPTAGATAARMITDDSALFRGRLRASSRLLGLDLGAKTIGMAIATLSIGIASPLGTIRRNRFQNDAEDLARLWTGEKVEGLVLGLPLNMDGRPGSRAQATRAFARNLLSFEPPPILLFDERLSSNEAGSLLRAAGASRANREARIDAYAAQVILQDALQHLRVLEDRPAR